MAQNMVTNGFFPLLHEQRVTFSLNCRDSNDKKAEAKAASALGNVHNKIKDHHAALQFHQLDLDISTNEDGSLTEAVDYQGQMRDFRLPRNMTRDFRMLDFFLSLKS